MNPAALPRQMAHALFVALPAGLVSIASQLLAARELSTSGAA